MSFLIYTFYLVTALYCLGLTFFLIGTYFPKSGQSTRQPFVSVVVAARNEEKNIGECLTHLTDQTYPTAAFEIIIVSDNSVDRTDEIIESFMARFENVRLLRVDGETNGITPKKNAITKGIATSKGEIILTTDADCRVKSTWVETMVSYFTDEVGLVIGFSQIGEQQSELALLEKLQALDFLALMTSAEGAANLGFALAASGQNLAYRRQAFDEVGGYARIGHRVSGDDVLLVQLIKQRTNWQIVFAHSEKAHNVTDAEKRLSNLLNQRIRWASNGPYQIFLNIPFFAYVLDTFLLNAGLAFFSITSLLGLTNGLVVLGPLAAKFLFELLIALRGTQIFKRKELRKHFPFWFATQIPYVLLVGTLGSWGNFTWKGRQHRIATQYLNWGKIENDRSENNHR